MEIVIDKKGDTKHEYFTRSKKKIVKKETNEKVKKSEIKDLSKNIKMVIKKKIKNKAIFKEDNKIGDGDSNDEDEDEDEDETDELDEHGNLKGFIDYSYDDDNITKNQRYFREYVILQDSILKNIRGAYVEDYDDMLEDEPEPMMSFDGDDIRRKILYHLKNNKGELSEDCCEKTEGTSERYKNRMILKKYNYREREYYESLSDEERKKLIELELQILEQKNDKIPMRFQILSNDMPIEIKTKILSKLDIIKNLDKSNSEFYKIKSWVEGILKIPFGKYCALPITLDDGSKAIKEYLVSVYKKLDKAVYGHNIAKTQLIQVITRWITNPSSKGFVLGIQGPPGNGKTTLVRQGISKAINKPFAFLTLGGATDASFLEGHSYTYEGSIPGRIVQILGEKNVNCMNPVFYFDELDKVSDTSRGHEIHNILCHLTDFSQNDEFHDKYYAGINFDLSKSLFVFSFNDEELINPILRDRMTIIRTKGFNSKDKIKLGRMYLLPELFNDVKMNSELVVFTDDVLKYIIEKYTDEMGVRNFKRCLEKIISKLNVIYLLGDISDMDITMDIVKNDEKMKFPLVLEKKIVDNLLTSKYELDEPTSRSHMAMYM